MLRGEWPPCGAGGQNGDTQRGLTFLFEKKTRYSGASKILKLFVNNNLTNIYISIIFMNYN